MKRALRIGNLLGMWRKWAIEVRRRRAMPYVQQLAVTDCGIACLAMVLKYYGKAVSQDELRNATISERDATNAQRLIETADRYGLCGRAVTLDLDQVECLDRGAILHWEFTHFVVLDRVRRDGIAIVDPSRGRCQVTMPQFARSFTGVALLFEPDVRFRPGRQSKRATLPYLKQIVSERGFLPHILITSLLLQLFGLGLPLLSRSLIDRVIPYHDYELLIVLGAGVAFVTLAQLLTSMVRSYLLLYLRMRLDSRMTLAFLHHLLDLPFEFFQRRSTGDLLNRVASNSTVREILTGTVLSTALDGSLAIGYLALLISLSPQMALLASCLASVQMSLFMFTRHRQRQLMAEGLEAQAKSNSYLVETLTAVELLKSVGAEKRAAEHWSGLFARELNVSLKRGQLDSVLESLGAALRSASAMALLGTAAIQVLAGRLTLGEMMALTAVANGFVPPLIALMSTAIRLQVLTAYLDRVNDVLQTPTEREKTGTVRLSTLSGAIQVENASFGYGPVSPLVVRNVSLDIRPGEFIAIVGRSASGKSTLARLLVGIYAPSEGRICYDGFDLADVDVTDLRRQIGVVTQRVHLFAGTIRSNIALADPLLPMAAVIRAAKLAKIQEEIVAMPMGYDTVLIDRGASLSGGQQQRLSLARALITEPRILVLDEATSQLDASTERAVQNELGTLACTRIVIAHRLSTVIKADRILVLDGGRLAEEGTHSELLSNNGLYAELVAAQLTTDATPAGP